MCILCIHHVIFYYFLYSYMDCESAINIYNNNNYTMWEANFGYMQNRFIYLVLSIEMHVAVELCI